MHKLFLILTLTSMTLFGQAATTFGSPSSKSINEGEVRKIFINSLMVGEYNENFNIMEVVFKQDIDNIEVIIYKDGIICENEYIYHVEETDYKSYLLSIYGTGKYSIFIKQNGSLLVSEDIYIK